MFEIVPAGTRIDFLGRRPIALAVSVLLFTAGLFAAFVSPGMKFGIDFAGGTEVAVRFEPGAEVDEEQIRGLASACGVLDDPVSVVRYGETERPEFLLRFNRVADSEQAADGCPVEADAVAELERIAAEADPSGETEVDVVDLLTLAMREQLGELEILRVEFVGPRVGDELRRDGLAAMGWAVFFILIYIAFRFSTRFAPGAVVALVHDIVITAGILVMIGVEFDLRVLAALLAIIGYSLNDTIIIYDRIRENMELRTKFDLVDVLNRSVNQTLSRTLLTSLTTLSAVLCLLVVGGEVIRPFAVAMAIGIVVGTYSSAFVAAPVLLFLEQRLGGGQAGGGKKAKPRAA